MLKVSAVFICEYGVTTTIAWRWILGADFPWWKPFVVGLVSVAFMLAKAVVLRDVKAKKVTP